MIETPLPLWVLIPGTVLLFVGGLLALLGAVGLLRMRDFYARMHPPTMGTTLGTGCVLMVSILVSSAMAERPVVHEILIGLFIMLSAPATGMLLMRAAVARGRKAAEGGAAATAADRVRSDESR